MYLERPAVNLWGALKTIFAVIVHKNTVHILVIMLIEKSCNCCIMILEQYLHNCFRIVSAAKTRHL